MNDTRPERGCLDTDEVLAFVDGTVSSAQRRRVEAHLGGCASCRALISELARPGDSAVAIVESTRLSGSADTSADSSLPLFRGDRIGRYAIERPLGAGAMGQVLLAQDLELKRPVALKLLHDAAEHAPFLEREAQALARLRHPNVVAVYDVGGHGQRRFVALEYVQGRTLTEWLKTPRSVRQLLEVFRAAGEGLSAAHAAGLVHRDFKPDNVLVGDDGAVKVSDFGLARAPAAAVTGGRNDSLSAQLSQAGELVGTPRYLAPEIFAGGPADPRSDQFGFCVALWEALAGERPFAGEDIASLRASVLEGTPRPLPAGHRVPGWLRPILLRGLSRRPERRYPSMAALLRAMELSETRASIPRRAILLSLAASVWGALLALGISSLGALAGFEARAQGELLARTRRAWSDEIRVVEIDERTLQRDHWRLPRGDVARVVAALGAAGAKAIALDGFFQAPALEGPQVDRDLAEVMRQGPPVAIALPCSHDQALATVADALARSGSALEVGATPSKTCSQLVLPVEPLRDSAVLAHVETARSAAGTLEGTYALATVEGQRLPTLAIAAYARANHLPIEQLPDRVKVGDSIAYVDARGETRVSFRIPFEDQLTSFDALLQALPASGPPRLPPALASLFHGRYVLIGTTAESAHDLGVFADGFRAPMMLLHGQLLADLIEKRPMRPMEAGSLWPLLLAFATLAAMSASRLPIRLVALALIAPMLGVVGLSLSFARTGVVTSPVLLGLGITLAFIFSLALRLAEQDVARRELGTVLQGQLREVGSSTARLLRSLSRDGARKRGTVLLARHPSAAAPEGTPEAALAKARRQLERAQALVWKEQGRIEACRLDHLVAVFGDPAARADHSAAAVRAGAELAREGWACATASGELLVGELGAPGDSHYGVLGPALVEASGLLPRARPGELHVGVANRADGRDVIAFEVTSEGFRLAKGHVDGTKKEPSGTAQGQPFKAPGSG